ncbi:hypothetical protein CCHL11_05227 [Colletotrichum chlorophyti]|uniref:Transcription factor RfeG n=1 Tax=Colletotrichum chlorophyti TaxID=708187 RepID=A0A1Q8RPA2_9PEZI|nr:hypothetical protein CCHL11_05227 [Colletotrichum chlorophyti]
MSARQSRGPPPSGSSGSAAPSSGRSNEYFVPRDGIDREVITADICRYLGNDALVRPGHYENPQTGQVVQGYYITAYRNLTTAMIDDLKADSARWEAERRQQAARNTQGAGYRQSETHSARQHYGPTDSTGYPDAQAYAASGGGYAYPAGASFSPQPDPRDPRYPGTQNHLAQGYGGEPPYTATAANLATRNYSADPYGAGQPPRTSTSASQQGQPYPSGSQASAGYGSSSGYYPPSSSAPYGSAPPVAQDPLYGRGAYKA